MSHFPVDKYRECDQFVLVEDTNNSAFEHEKEYIKSEYDKAYLANDKVKQSLMVTAMDILLVLFQFNLKNINENSEIYIIRQSNLKIKILKDYLNYKNHPEVYESFSHILRLVKIMCNMQLDIVLDLSLKETPVALKGTHIRDLSDNEIKDKATQLYYAFMSFCNKNFNGITGHMLNDSINGLRKPTSYDKRIFSIF